MAKEKTWLISRNSLSQINKLFKKHELDQLIIRVSDYEVYLAVTDECGEPWTLSISQYGDVDLVKI